MAGFGRLKSGVTPAQAQAEMDVISSRLEQEDPDRSLGWGAKVVSCHEMTTGDIGQALWILLGAVGFLLLIACANVANMLLAPAAARRTEIAMWTALGASRSRILRQLLTESLLVAVTALASYVPARRATEVDPIVALRHE